MRQLVCLFGIVALTACATENGLDRAMLGRWDGNIEGEESYPLWFELTERDGELAGRLQPRSGHTLTLSRVEASGDTLEMAVEGASYRGTFDGESWSGTGAKDGASFTWTAVRAPELPAPTDPSWGDPVGLFDGEDLSGWIPRSLDHPNQWKAEDGVLVNEASGSDLLTQAKFGDFELHIEVNVPEGSNSGIYLRARHEVQVQDDYGKAISNVRMGAVYGQITPSSNAALPADEWQSFDITLLGRFVTVVLNGETIIEDQEIPGITGGALDANEGEPGPILLQGDHGRILYRNIVLTPAVP